MEGKAGDSKSEKSPYRKIVGERQAASSIRLRLFAVFLSSTELKFRADYNSTPCGVGVVVVVVVVVVGVRVHFKKWITF